MNYSFPHIETLDDVLPAIEGYEEFIVVDKEDYTVVNYAVSKPNTFDMKEGGAIRRECRGIIFDAQKRILSRPFHKFFNVNEREETQQSIIDLSHPHVVMEKMDGSMIRPLLINNSLRLATKMGITEVSMQAEEWLARHPHKKEWLKKRVRQGMTDLFEWTSPRNRIVLEYEQEDLVYLGSRVNVTGEYCFESVLPFTSVPRYGSLDNIHEYIDRQREVENREGDIIRFHNGHMLKIKNSWYVRLHKVLDSIRQERNIAELVLYEAMDDIVAQLPEEEVKRIRDFECQFWDSVQSLEEYFKGLHKEALEHSSRKEVALQLVPQLRNKTDARFVFSQLDQKPLRETLLNYIKTQTSNNVKWEQCKQWMKL